MYHPIIEKLNSAIGKFAHTAWLYRLQGAEDTEPQMVFHSVLYGAFTGSLQEVSCEPRFWKLTETNTDVCKHGGKLLAERAQACVDLIKNCPKESRDDVMKFLKMYCWRIDEAIVWY